MLFILTSIIDLACLGGMVAAKNLHLEYTLGIAPALLWASLLCSVVGQATKDFRHDSFLIGLAAWMTSITCLVGMSLALQPVVTAAFSR